ncbi:PEP-CTERM sorting domain-containing protein [Lusitaniella coriacea]|uniref:PEP-CTERM sorting domain-containing protein n=1 Tax=Lusitaniella coriacea TaxID=1983105 RepID=UPI003CFB6F8D
MSKLNLLQKLMLTGVASAITATSGSLLATPSALAATVFRDSGNIGDTVDAFRAALGDPNNGNAPGSFSVGRREINWDAGIVPFDMPPDFFNKTVTRGAEFSTDAGNEFGVSNPSVGDPDFPDNKFDSLNPTYSDEFMTFSDPRLFTPLGTNVMETNFFVPGSDMPAAVSGFGAVFTDVDLPDITKIEYFDIQGNLLASEFVDPDPQGLSFLGVSFDAPILFNVKITLGNTPIGSNDDPGNNVDVVVLDDFIYGEPNKVPEPATTLGLLALGVFGADLLRKRQHNR